MYHGSLSKITSHLAIDQFMVHIAQSSWRLCRCMSFSTFQRTPHFLVLVRGQCADHFIVSDRFTAFDAHALFRVILHEIAQAVFAAKDSLLARKFDQLRCIAQSTIEFSVTHRARLQLHSCIQFEQHQTIVRANVPQILLLHFDLVGDVAFLAARVTLAAVEFRADDAIIRLDALQRAKFLRGDGSCDASMLRTRHKTEWARIIQVRIVLHAIGITKCEQFMRRMVDVHVVIGASSLASSTHVKCFFEKDAKTLQRTKVHVIPTNTTRVVETHLVALLTREILQTRHGETVAQVVRHYRWRKIGNDLMLTKSWFELKWRCCDVGHFIQIWDCFDCVHGLQFSASVACDRNCNAKAILSIEANWKMSIQFSFTTRIDWRRRNRWFS